MTCHCRYIDNISLKCVFSSGFEEQLESIMTCHSQYTDNVSLKCVFSGGFEEQLT